MNPNSANQRWSLWEYRVYPAGLARPGFARVKQHCAWFGRLLFGSASQMHIRAGTDAGRPFWEIKVLTEGHPVHDPAYTAFVHQSWRRFFTNGFGAGAQVDADARLSAGDRQDGRPADQLILLPGIRVADAAERM